MNSPSRTSSANSRTLDGSDFPTNKGKLYRGILRRRAFRHPALKPKEPPCFTFAISWASKSPPTVSSIASTARKELHRLVVVDRQHVKGTEGAGVIQVFAANACDHLRAYLLCRMHRRAPNTAQGSRYQNKLSLFPFVARRTAGAPVRAISGKPPRRPGLGDPANGPRPNRPLRLTWIGPVGKTKNAVPDLQLLHILAHRSYDATHIAAQIAGNDNGKSFRRDP